MKSILLIFFVLFIQISVAQHLTFSNLLTLYESNTEECDEILIKKGFVFSDSKIINDNKSKEMRWIYKRSQSFDSFNEFLEKNCSIVFMNNCNAITYAITDMNHFNLLKESMKSGFNKFLFSDTNDHGVLSHHYLGVGPLEFIFSTLPTNLKLTVKVFVIEIKKMEITVK